MNANNRCGNCVFWTQKKPDSVMSDSIENSYGTCKSDGFSYEEIPDNRTDMLIYGDYEGYSAGFDTGKDFGCVHWSALST